MTKNIPLGGKSGKIVIVDDADFDELSQYKWHYMSAGYAARNLPYTGKPHQVQLMHRQILDAPKGAYIDHVDGDKLNNTRSNLRLVTQSQNNMNSQPRKKSTSRYKGVYWNEYHGRWQSRIQIDGKIIFLGRFTTQRLAALAYNEAAKKHFGEYARLNEIVDDPSDTPVAAPHPPKTAMYRGVCWDKSRQAWSAKIQVSGRTVNLGRFLDEVEAAKAYDEAARKHHGDAAKLNFP